jgi:hypothetical protein
MPRRVRQRRVAEIAVHARFRLLPYEVEVTADDDRLASKIAYLANHAEQPAPLKLLLRYGVEGHGPYDVFEDSERLQSVPTPDDALVVLYERCYGRLVDHLSVGGWLPLHGGLVTIAGRRLLVVGQKGAGKTTLMLRLLYDGHAVEGDEMVFTRGGVAVALPRSFHLKPGADALIPEIRARFDDLPSMLTSDGTHVTAFDPGAEGFGWALGVGLIDGAVVLRPNHGGETSVRNLSSLELVQAALDHSYPTSDSRPMLLRSITAMLGRVDGIELTVGSVATAAASLVTFATVSSV